MGRLQKNIERGSSNERIEGRNKNKEHRRMQETKRWTSLLKQKSSGIGTKIKKGKKEEKKFITSILEEVF